MRFEPLSKASFGSDDPYFNTEAAIEVFNWYMKEDTDTANLVLNDIFSKRVSDIAKESGEEINKNFNELIDERLEILKRSLANGIINKSMSNDSIDRTIEAVDIIKDFKEAEHWRGPDGRFRSMGRSKIDYISAPHNSDKQAVNENQHRQAIAQAGNVFVTHGNGGMLQADVTYRDEHGNRKVTRRQGFQASDIVGDSADEFFGGADGREKERIETIDWFGPDARDLGQDTKDLLAMGSSMVTNGTPVIGESGTTRNMKQLKTIADTADKMGLGVNPKAKMAIQAGKTVGELGPQAERYAGPSIRRLG